jgi:hypothetical protein
MFLKTPLQPERAQVVEAQGKVTDAVQVRVTLAGEGAHRLRLSERLGARTWLSRPQPPAPTPCHPTPSAW